MKEFSFRHIWIWKKIAECATTDVSRSQRPVDIGQRWGVPSKDPIVSVCQQVAWNYVRMTACSLMERRIRLGNRGQFQACKLTNDLPIQCSALYRSKPKRSDRSLIKFVITCLRVLNKRAAPIASLCFSGNSTSGARRFDTYAQVAVNIFPGMNVVNCV
jgi:hypothetical protein